ncbi:class I SAM-dependent methyltransferase [Abyssibacter sp.]|uniref:class I SAM-dependent methyltransferase n=1 Tax=Abyssibacter sp. TaxID=2320200 RepID=UPI000C3583F1|nr:class I SAM-dependent methyltransferase [Abyssibacter sp.]MBB85692.1 SAM-dependent methyltransferase [Xanthomonadales bacterium]MCK5859378.1 methyltransferase domain-containing protein [Abyssibacter sp.]
MYERWILPYLLDFACGIRPVRLQRQKIVPLARGRVLEIGIGTGLNLPHYVPGQIDSLQGLDPGVSMHRLAQKRLRATGLSAELIPLSAESIPMPGASFDTVVCTYTLCTIPDAAGALSEMRRVLKPDGRLLFCEHGRAPDPGVATWQARLNKLWSPIAGGCRLDRNIPDLLDDAGFRVESLEQMYLPGPRVLTYNYWGSAQAAA